MDVRRMLVAVLVLPLLGACSGDPQPRFEPSSPAASTSSDPPSPKPWEKHSQAGAVAFARHWIDVFNKAGASGSTTDLAAVSQSGCKSCANFADQIESLYGEGGYLESDGWRVISAVAAPGMPSDHPEITLRVKRLRQDVHRADGTLKTYSPSQATYTAHLGWTAHGWTMHELVLMS